MSNLSQQFVFQINTTTPAVKSIGIPTTAVGPNGALLFYSDKLKGDGYYNTSDGLHTVSYTVGPSFQGTCTVQASLAVTPGDTDWFDVDSTAITYTPTGSGYLTTTTNYINFTGNFVWVRAKVQRAVALPLSVLLYTNYNH